MKSSQIKRTKAGTKKNEKYLSVYGDDRKKLLESIIFACHGIFTLPRLQEKISDEYGVFASSDCTEKVIRGLACCQPAKISAAFTLGLNEVRIK